MNLPEKHLPKEAIAELLGVHPRTVWRWWRQGRITGHWVGARLRFLWSEVEPAAVLPAKTTEGSK